MSEHKHPGYSEVISKAWNDPAYKASLMADPIGVLKAAGVPVPKDMKIQVVENTSDVLYMVLPLPPTAKPFRVQLGNHAKDEITVRCDKCCSLGDVITNHS